MVHTVVKLSVVIYLVLPVLITASSCEFEYIFFFLHRCHRQH